MGGEENAFRTTGTGRTHSGHMPERHNRRMIDSKVFFDIRRPVRSRDCGGKVCLFGQLTGHVTNGYMAAHRGREKQFFL